MTKPPKSLPWTLRCSGKTTKDDRNVAFAPMDLTGRSPASRARSASRSSSCTASISSGRGGCDRPSRRSMDPSARRRRIAAWVAASSLRSSKFDASAASGAPSGGTAPFAGLPVAPSTATIVVAQEFTRTSTPASSTWTASVRTSSDADPVRVT